MREIPLTQGKVTFVDAEDYEWLSKLKWYFRKSPKDKGYARRVANGKTIYLHRFIINAKPREIVDHINGNTLDNRKSNLRIVSIRENVINSSSRGVSKYKGVSLHKKTGRYRARIVVNGRELSLGYFDREEDAAIAYNIAANEYFGEFARLNEIGVNGY
ncbi:AP2 domain-containing protein [Ornithinibacillus sp. JPR2-1]|uniref:AP2 domain-containing protein n=1 Tax=Ornithinibacillus sp. JPR2-1 TaxID=2094019 RepID=UPI0031DE3099